MWFIEPRKHLCNAHIKPPQFEVQVKNFKGKKSVNSTPAESSSTSSSGGKAASSSEAMDMGAEQVNKERVKMAKKNKKKQKRAGEGNH